MGLQLPLKASTETANRRTLGRAFHSVGATTSKAQCFVVRRVRGTNSKPMSPTDDIRTKQGRDVNMCLTMRGSLWSMNPYQCKEDNMGLM